MYEAHFGFDRSPFKITPDTSLFYTGGHRGDILGALIYAVHRGEGMIKVVGEVGSGKTMLCRMLQLELPDNVEIIYIANPSVSPQDILFVIADELKFDIARDASKHELVSMLQNYLLQKHGEGKQVVLFIEEAQGMPLETLEEIRLLSNLETDRHKLLQIILFGQPELDQNLASKSIRQLRERITHDFHLAPLNADEVHNYLDFRMREVGYSGPELVNEKLAQKIALYSEGLLRRINILADKMLLSAYADGTHDLTQKHLDDAVRDSGFSRVKAGQSGKRWVWATAAAVAVLFVTFFAWQHQAGLETAGGPGSASEPDPQVTDQADLFQPQPMSGLPSAAVLQETLNDTVEIPVDLAKTAENQQSAAKLDNNDGTQKTIVSQTSNIPPDQYEEWLDSKLETSKNWLRNANKQAVSIQVMMRNKKASKELVNYLRRQWPMEIDKTYLFEVVLNENVIYQVFYEEYPSISIGELKMQQLPESVKKNSPYLHPIHLMQKALL